jgi:hypothetical protein
MTFFNTFDAVTRPVFPFLTWTSAGTVLVLLLFTSWKLKVFSTFRWIEVMFVVIARSFQRLSESVICLFVGLTIEKK